MTFDTYIVFKKEWIRNCCHYDNYSLKRFTLFVVRSLTAVHGIQPYPAVTSSYITLPPTLKFTFESKVSSKKALFTANTSIGGPMFTTENLDAILLTITD
jgi:hypothetical protein